MVCISTGYDIKMLENMKFLEKAEELILASLGTDDLEASSQSSSRKPSIVQDYMGSFTSNSNLNINPSTEQEMMGLPRIGDMEKATLEDKKFRGVFRKAKSNLEKFTREWNADEANRDKTYTVYN